MRWTFVASTGLFLACGGLSAAESADREAGVVRCGSQTCTIGTGDFCCTPFGSSETSACKSTCAEQADSLKCDGPEDCPGQACCGVIGRDGTRAACADACVAGRDLRMCHADSDCLGAKCCPLLAYPGVGSCEAECN